MHKISTDSYIGRLTDREWSVIAPMLPARWRGRQRVDDRLVISGILWRLRTGKPWASMPSDLPPHTICVKRYLHWRNKGVWALIINAILMEFGNQVRLIDCSSIRVFRPYIQRKRTNPDPVAWALHDNLSD